jgi:hypothetical protein
MLLFIRYIVQRSKASTGDRKNSNGSNVGLGDNLNDFMQVFEKKSIDESLYKPKQIKVKSRLG